MEIGFNIATLTTLQQNTQQQKDVHPEVFKPSGTNSSVIADTEAVAIQQANLTAQARRTEATDDDRAPKDVTELSKEARELAESGTLASLESVGSAALEAAASAPGTVVDIAV